MSVNDSYLKNIAISAFTVLLLALITYLYWMPAGEASPNVTFSTLDNQVLSLQQLRGKPVIINFWATSCPGCIKEIPDLISLYDNYHPQGLEIIGIAMDYDPEKQVRAMVKKKSIRYPIVLDSHAKFAQLFGDISLTPTTLFISPDGFIVARYLGQVSQQQLTQFVQLYL